MSSLRCFASSALPWLVGCYHGSATVETETTDTGSADGDGPSDGSEATTTTTTTSGAEDADADGSSGPEPDVMPDVRCGPTGGGPHWLREGETLNATLSCTTGLTLPGDAFSVGPLPRGATYDPATAELRWTPELDQGAVYELEITAESEVGTMKIGVADRFDDPDNVPVVDAALYGEEYGLPVFHLDADPAIDPDTYTPATVVYRGHTYVAEAKYRGAASLGYPKKSFTVEFAREDKFSEPERAGGFLEKRKIVLTTTFDDNSYVRQRLAFELWNRLDPGHIRIQAYNAVVFLDGEYWGLYMIGDHVDGFLMEDHGYRQDGNLYKARTHDANFRLTSSESGGPKSTPHDGLTKEEGLPLDGEPGAYDDLDELVTFVATAGEADFLSEIDLRIDRRDYENWWIFVSLIEADDSAGKNSYHYHDPAGGLWRFAPWDFNHCFGQTWQTEREAPDVDPESYSGYNELFGRLLARFGDPMRTRYGTALRDQYELEAVLELVRDWSIENRPSALRDESLWGEDYRDYSGWNWRSDFVDHDGEVEYLLQWIEDRWDFVAARY